MFEPGWGGDNEHEIRYEDIGKTQHYEPPVSAGVFDEDIAFLKEFGSDFSLLNAIQNRAKMLGVPAAQVLIANGHMSEHEYYNCVAFKLGVPFVETIPTTSTPFFYTPTPTALERMARIVVASSPSHEDGRNLIYIAPDCRQLGKLKELLSTSPLLANRIRVTTPTANTQNLLKRSEPDLMQTATNGLRDRYAEFSAKRVISAWQAVILLFCMQGLIIGSIYKSGIILVGLHLFASLIYFFCIGVRLFSVITFGKRKRAEAEIIHYPDHSLPVYSVLIAMYQEAGQVEGLVAALMKLKWPAEKLEIKLVCEQDDRETVLAVKATLARFKNNFIRLVEVPKHDLRTKPKALNYALPLCLGDIVVIYDAEDRPDPLQLREAYQTFLEGPPELVCVQAPLSIHNYSESWFSKLFAVEYSSLFDGLLPMLSRTQAPIPLGGTSNHFKREILNRMGAWDPYNVTEDADIGIRLARGGYRIQTITRATYEEAPVHFSVWLKQRTRWFKGWYQTWLVHMRHPVYLTRDLGIKGTLIFHTMITGMAISSLVHPVILYFFWVRINEFAKDGFIATVSDPLFLLDVTTVVLGYGSFVALALMTLPLRNLSHLRIALFGLPIYWMFLSMAAWRAIWHLIRRPHQWEKTPHRLKGPSGKNRG